jgi:micrococcal nuclease
MRATMTRLGGILVGGALLLAVASQAQAGEAQAGAAYGSGPYAPASAAPAQQPTWMTKPLRLVVRVVDGDTIDVAVGGTRERVRLLGIDTPETVHPYKPVQCYGKQASAKVTALLLGKRVRLEGDRGQGNRDHYGRLLRYVRMPSGTNLNRYLVATGYAREYTYGSPYRYQASFKAAERQARGAGRGLWGACPAYPPPVVAAGVDRDCKDFATQRAAQAYFDRRGGNRTRNVDGLDGDGDGIVCEALPR